MKDKGMVMDMTIGSPIKLILLFALPILLGSVFQQFYNVVDTVIAGRYLGSTGLAAIGATTAIYSLAINLVCGMNNGYAIIVSRSYGEGSEEKIRNSVALMLVLNIIISLLFTVAALIIIKPVLNLLNTPGEIFDSAHSYIFIIISGLIITILYNMESAVLRALGNSVTPLIFLIVASLFNVVLDIIFVAVFKMGTAGLALATVMAQLISVILCYIHIKLKYPVLKLHRKNFQFTMDSLKEMFLTGLSMGMMYSIFSFGTVILQGAINAMGTVTITAHVAARKLMELLSQPLGTVATANGTFVSQNYGAGKIQRIREGIRKSIITALIWSLIATIMTFGFSKLMVVLMTSTKDSEVIKLASTYLITNIPFFGVLSVLIILRTSLQGLGEKITPLISSTIELAAKVLATWLIIPRTGYIVVCLLEPVIWVICMLWLIRSYRVAIKFKDNFGEVI